MDDINDILDMSKEDVLQLSESEKNTFMDVIIKDFLFLIRPVDYYVYGINNTKYETINMNVSCIIDFKNNPTKKYIGYDYFPLFYDEQLNKDVTFELPSRQFGVNIIDNLNSKMENLRKLIEVFGYLLNESEYYYEIETEFSKIYGNLIIPLFFKDEYTIRKHKNEIYENDNVTKINSNCIEYDPSHMDENLKCNNYKVLNPFGFDNGHCHIITEMHFATSDNSYKNKYYSQQYSFELSDECKNGLKKIIIRYPH